MRQYFNIKGETMTEEYVRQHPRTRLGEEAIKAVDLLSKALDNAMEANQERCSTAHKALQARDEALEDAKNLRERYAELQAMHLSGIDLHNAQRDLGFCREALRVASDDKAALKTKLEVVQRNLADWRMKYDFVKSDKDVWQQRAEKAEEKLSLLTPKRTEWQIKYPEPPTELKKTVEFQTVECRLTVAEQVEGLETRAKNHENWLNAAAGELDCDLDQVAEGIRKLKRTVGAGEQTHLADGNSWSIDSD